MAKLKQTRHHELEERLRFETLLAEISASFVNLPPDYKGDVPEGYFVFRSPTYLNFSFIRANAAVVGFGDKAVKFYRDHCKV